MAAPKRTKREREYDLELISDLYLKGWIQARIVDHMASIRSYSLDQSTISRDIKTIRGRWLDSSVRNFDEARAQELAKIDHLETIYYEQWDKSLFEDDLGNPRFLSGVQWCIDRRCKLLGLDSPLKAEIQQQSIDLADLTDAQLQRLAAGEDLMSVLTEKK